MKKLRLPVACACVLAATAANAQQGDTEAQEPAPGEVRTLADVVVTAERREQNLQKTPIAISAVDGEEIRDRGLTSIGDILLQTPSVVMQGFANGQSVFIRGVGSTGDAQEGGDPAVNLSIDGVYQQQAVVALANALDVQRVEVLRGPQGTLYGRNSNAGSINVITRDPELDGVSGSTMLELGNYDSFRTESTANLPIGDALAARVAYGTSKRDGYLSNGANAQDSTAARLKLLYRPSDELTVRFTADRAHETGTPPATVPLPISTSDPWQSNVLPGVQDVELTRVYGQLDYDFDFGTFTILPAYSYTRQYQDSMLLPVAAIAQEVEERAKSAEFRLVSRDDGRTRWVAGLYYYESENERNPDAEESIDAPRQEFTTEYPSDSWRVSSARSYAAYGQATFSVSERFRLIGGLRHNVDEKGFDLLTETSEGVYVPGPSHSHEFKATTWRAGLEWEASERSFLYGHVSTGMKGGGFNTTDYSTYEPEEITAFEIGSKNRFLDDRLQVNVGAFYYDYENYQARLPYPDETAAGGFSQKILNATTAEIYGAELELRAAPTTNDQINLGISYLHARYGDFIYDSENGLVDWSGRTMPNAPTWSGSLGYAHFWDLASGATLTGRVDLRYSGRYDSSIDDAPLGLDLQSAYTRTDVALIYTSADGRWGLRLYARNLEDKAQRMFTIAPIPEISAAMVSDPRTYGVALNLNF